LRRQGSQIFKDLITSRVIPFARKYGRILFLAAGLATFVALVYHVGPARLWAVLASSWPIIPALVVLDIAWMSLESIALLLFYGPEHHKIPVRNWLKALFTHYATMVVLPVGRVGAEIARAAMLAPHVGSHRVAAGAAQMQIMVLYANTVICIPCFFAAVQLGGWSGSLAALLIFNFFANGLLGLGLHLFTRNVHIGGWLSKKFESMLHWGPELDAEFRRMPRLQLVPGLLCLSGRALQTVEYGLVLATVAGTAMTLSGTLVAEGIHIGAAALGDAVPNQVGVAEGMYRLFAGALGLGDHPEKALAIAIVVRVANFCVAGMCFGVLGLWPRGQERAETAPALAPNPEGPSRSS
jgi:hypothetical protein